MKNFGTKLVIFRLIMKDSRTPFLTKLLVGVALIYLLAPLDILPDIFSLVGLVDDIIIVPLLILTALKIIPPGLIQKYREIATKQKKEKIITEK